LDAIIISPTGVIGPNDYKPSRMGQVLMDISRNRLPALIDGGYNWVDARDVIKLTLAEAETAPSGEKYLASGTWGHFRDLVLPHINTVTYRGRRGARSARREEEEYSIVFDRRATQQTGMHRRPNATVFM
jgi:hypothetical protein